MLFRSCETRKTGKMEDSKSHVTRPSGTLDLTSQISGLRRDRFQSVFKIVVDIVCTSLVYPSQCHYSPFIESLQH